MKSSLLNLCLTGTALVAVGAAFAPSANASPSCPGTFNPNNSNGGVTSIIQSNITDNCVLGGDNDQLIVESDGSLVVNSGNAVLADFGVEGLEILNRGGLIESTGDVAIRNFGAVTTINNTGTIRGAGGIFEGGNGSALTINNIGGTIDGTSGPALILNNGLAAPIDNTGGLLTSWVSAGSAGTILIDDSFSDAVVINGGTVDNTYGVGPANVIHFQSSGKLVLNNVHVDTHGHTGVNAISAAGDTEITLNTGTVLDGNITSSGGAISLTTNTGSAINGFIVGGSNGDHVTFNGGTLQYGADLDGGNNTITVGGNFATSGQGGIDTSSRIDFTVLDGARFTSNDHVDLGSGDLIVNSGGQLYVADNEFESEGTLENYGSIRIGKNSSFYFGDSVANGTLTFDVGGDDGDMETGQFGLNDGKIDFANQTININYTGGLLNVGSWSAIGSGDLTADITGATIADNSFLYDFSLSQGTHGRSNKDVILETTSARSLEEVVNNSTNLGSVKAIQSIGSGNTQIDAISAKIAGASSQQEVNDILEATAPTVDNGNQTAAIGMTGAMFDLANGQLVEVNTGSTGIATGDILKGAHVWTQGFGSKANQGQRDGVAGYDADVTGLAVGVDTRNLNEKTTVGASFGYASTDVASHNTNRTKTDVDSYQLMAYGNHDLGNNNFATGMAVVGYGKNTQTRHDVGGVSGLNANADYDSWTTAARAAVGRNLFAETTIGNVKVSPQGFSEYVYFKRDGYTETGAGGANLTTDSASQHILNLGAGIQASTEIKAKHGLTLEPEVHASYKYDILGERADTTASFAAGGSTFDVQGVDPARSTAAVGTGVKLTGGEGWNVTANYDYTLKSDYTAHSGFLRAGFKF